MKYKITKYSLIVIDIGLIVFAFLFVAWLKSPTKLVIRHYFPLLIPFMIIWIGSGIWRGKYTVKEVGNGYKFLNKILKSNLVASVSILALMYLLEKFYYSRAMVFGTMLISTVAEIFIFVGIYYAFSFHKENAPFASTRLFTQSPELEESDSTRFYVDASKIVPIISDEAYDPPFTCLEDTTGIHSLLENGLDGNSQLYDFIDSYVSLQRISNHSTVVGSTANIRKLHRYVPQSLQMVINLHMINDFRRINVFFIKINELLMEGGVFVCCGETISQRKNRFYRTYTPYLGMMVYGLDFVFQRVVPKLPILQGWYFALTKGKNRPLPETEMLGRLYYCGFELIHKKAIDGLMYFILRKAKAPSQNPNPTYGPFIQLKRKGLDGKIIYIKKLRTMHPYSEFLQDYVFRTSDLQEGGKFKNDFRVTSWGKVFRKLWIDELPQFVNLLKGEVSLVGVRALSEHYFSLYPPDMQELRCKVKPGLIPPFYADMPKTFEDIIESERRYLHQKLAKPVSTDWRYFWKAFWNIAIKRARSN